MVDAEAFEDRRNPPTRVNAQPRDEEPEPSWDWTPADYSPPWALPEVAVEELPTIDANTLPRPSMLEGWQVEWDHDNRPSIPEQADVEIDGYDYATADQPVLLEVWVEKSTVNDVLVPLCEELRVNLRVGMGIESITHALHLLQRAQAMGRPAHVFYISDYDPGGEVMPYAVAREAQYYREFRGMTDVELTLEPLFLTEEQVDEYDLPRKPGGKRDTDRRYGKFEERHGGDDRVVELDALEAVHPGLLAETLRHAVNEWRDPELSGRLRQAAREAERVVAETWTTATEAVRGQTDDLIRDVEVVRRNYQGRLDSLAQELAELQEPYREFLTELGQELEGVQRPIAERLGALRRELADELAPYRERMDSIEGSLDDVVNEFDPELPERPEPDEPAIDRDELLFDSRRHWWDQLKVFKRFKDPHVDGWWAA